MKDIITQFAGQDAGAGGFVAPSSNKANPGAYTSGQGGDLDTTVINIINAVIGVIGLACVVVMIIGGVNYMTSSGDPGKVKKAKDTILYGVIGLVVCVLAFAIVNFVITNIIQ